jgi:hypothetical protein
MADPPRKATPAPFGLGPLPPPRSRSYSQPDSERPSTVPSTAPAAERNYLESILTQIKERLDTDTRWKVADQAWKQGIEERISAAEKILDELKRGQIEIGDLRVSIDRAAVASSALRGSVEELLASDIVQEGKIKALQRVSRRSGGITAALVSIVGGGAYVLVRLVFKKYGVELP